MIPSSCSGIAGGIMAGDINAPARSTASLINVPARSNYRFQTYLKNTRGLLLGVFAQ